VNARQQPYRKGRHMAITSQMMDTDADTQRLIDAVVRNLVAAQTGAGARDLGADVGMPSAELPAADDEAQRFFGSVLNTFVSQVVPTVVPQILGMLQQRRRELGLPEQRDTASVERDLGSILGALLPKLVAAIPSVVDAISGRPAPRSADEENERFLPLLGALIPAVVSAVPSIIGAFNQQRGADATPPPYTDPDVAQRFLGPLLAVTVPALVQAAPSILGSIFGGGRAVAATTW
jgi:hypothetical protein